MNPVPSIPSLAPAAECAPIDVRTSPEQYRHWHLAVEEHIATLTLDVDEHHGIAPGYVLKRNSYDLGVDIELADAVQRLRFEHPEVSVVIITSGQERVFSAGANIRMLGTSSHADKVNFCKFTNETRLAMEDASTVSRQRYLTAINGTAAGGGYELALATDWILLIDDGVSAVSLPEVPLLGVLPGTGGLVRMVDKRKIRRDHADCFCTAEEGVRGKRALEWGLVDELAPPSRLADTIHARAAAFAALRSDELSPRGVPLGPIERNFTRDRLRYRWVEAHIERDRRTADITVGGPDLAAPTHPDAALALGDAFWPLALARELDDLVLHLRHNEPEIGTFVVRSHGVLDRVATYDIFLAAESNHWFVREVLALWKRLLKRVDLTSRSLIALIEPGSCFAGFLLELVLAADRSYMLDTGATAREAAAAISIGATNFGYLPMPHGLTRLEARYLGAPETTSRARQAIGRTLDASAAEAHGLVTFIPDLIDWDDEVRIALEERAAFSPDALTGMEASLRCPGPETMESRIFGRLSAWQNWIFQRPNATGEHGALSLYGTGARPKYSRTRV